ncbi:MAG: aminoglycoside phosphotransferase family protein [Chloroflexi bacterium]|nr:aminoglycoside phosphotransferase family protein [Chloroflexota bacterium]
MNEVRFHSPEHMDNQKYVDFVRREMGSRVQIDNFSRDFGRPSIVWRLTRNDGSRAWFKHHEMRRLYERELIGLEQFVPALGTQTWWQSPTVISRDDELAVILMTEVSGELLDSTPVSSDERTRMFRMAGRFIRKLHDADISDPEGIDAAEHLRDRMAHYLGQGEKAVDDATATWARELIDDACSVTGVRRVPCHMDFSPRNWLILRDEPGTGFGVIDWERTRWDLWQQDVQRMEYDHFHREPHLRDAYFEGYGRDPTEHEQLQLNTISLVTAIASIPWAIDHNDATFVELSRTQIERIREKVG